MRSVQYACMSSKWLVSSSGRLDVFLSEMVEDVSRSRLKKAIESGFVEVNGEEILSASYKLKESDEVYLLDGWNERKAEYEIIPIDLQLNVIYEDDDCVVINKPAGIAVHPGSGMKEDENTLLNGIAFLFKERSIPFSSDNVLVHRIDKDTTGCLLVAKSEKVHGLLQKQFENRDVSKKYLCIVAGIPDPSKAIIDAPIGRSLTDRTTMSILRTSKSRHAKTTYEILDNNEDVSLLECGLHTGRTHQIRVHLKSINHPILGDTTYCLDKSKSLSKKYGVTSFCLHAWKIEFVSPIHLKKIKAEAELPESFCGILLKTKLNSSLVHFLS